MPTKTKDWRIDEITWPIITDSGRTEKVKRRRKTRIAGRRKEINNSTRWKGNEKNWPEVYLVIRVKLIIKGFKCWS